MSEMTTVAGSCDAVVETLLGADEMAVVRFLAAAGPATKRLPVASDTLAASKLVPPCMPTAPADPTRDVDPNTFVPGPKRRSSLQASSGRVLTTETVGTEIEGGWIATVVVTGRVSDPTAWTLVGCTAGGVFVMRREAPSLFWGSPTLGIVEAGATESGLLLDTTVKTG